MYSFTLTWFYLLIDIVSVGDHDILYIRSYHVVTENNYYAWFIW